MRWATVCQFAVALGCLFGLPVLQASVLSRLEIVEVRYQDGASNLLNTREVREAEPAECGVLPHFLESDNGERWCGQYNPDKLQFQVRESAHLKTQSYGQASLSGYDLPSPRTAILSYEWIGGSPAGRLNYDLVANHRPGIQLTASQNGSIQQHFINMYKLEQEVFGYSSSIAIRQFRIGQLVTDSGPLAASLGQGVEWRKSSRLAQSNVQVFSGRLVSDTELTVLVNNQPRVTLPVQAGDVGIYNLPLVEGNNQVAVIYRNEKGELVQVDRTIFFSQSLQPKGRWEGAAGIYRDIRLGHWAAQAQIEKGVSNTTTVQVGGRFNFNADDVMAPALQGMFMRPVRPVELAVAARHLVAGGFLSAGFQSETAYGPGIQRVGYAHGSQLLFAEKALGPAKVGVSFDPFWLMGFAGADGGNRLPEGWRLGYMKALEGPEFEYTVSRFFRTDFHRGAYMSLFCKLGRDSQDASLQYCGINANMALGAAGFNSPNPLQAGLSYSRVNSRDSRTAASSQESLNGFLQTRDTFLLVSDPLSYARMRHDFRNFSVAGQVDSLGQVIGSVGGIIGIDYGQQARVLGYLPKDPARPADALVSIQGLEPARSTGYGAVQTRINGMVSDSNLNGGALVGQHNQILLNPESVSMDSNLKSIRLKVSPALSGIYKVDADAN